MSQVRNYRDLNVWNDAMDLVVDVYTVTRVLPKSELYGLTGQMRRAAISVPSNIAEGNGRLYRKEYAHHVSMARGSAAELSTCLEIAHRLDYIGADDVAALLRRADGISRMLLQLNRALDKPSSAPR
jgi:four helix bundle protein